MGADPLVNNGLLLRPMINHMSVVDSGLVAFNLHSAGARVKRARSGRERVWLDRDRSSDSLE